METISGILKLFLKGQRITILGLVVILSLLQLLNSAGLAWKQPQAIWGNWVSVAVFQGNFIYKIRQQVCRLQFTDPCSS